ncbi:hypothetical protein [Gephyromycinifex aptenodytis]|uniref:hypothetical protein n=1 Tax=Gephyromycinifex aptenodytis TaxID=2716227 RepID=UPI001446D3D7|nr:hypothetical protein [Gephyromycinifex aptenodytis]
MRYRLSRAAAAATVIVFALAGCSASNGSNTAQTSAAESSDTAKSSPESPTPSPTPTRQELPGGGTEVFPEYRLVGFSGYPGVPALGRMGIGNLDDRVVEMKKVAEPFAMGRKVMPVMELIATVVHGSPMKNGKYSAPIDTKVVDDHLAASKKHGAMLLLDIQPGRSDFLTEVKYWEKYLKEPNVGVALDPEWRMGPNEIPMRTFGSVNGKELDEVSAYLAKLVDENNLPQKVMVVHQLRKPIVKNEELLQERKQIAAVKSVDGIGSKGMKVETWGVLTKGMNPAFAPGFKLFYEEDKEFGPLMTPIQVMELTPTPEYILYE